MTGKQVRLFLADGTPGGLTTAEITNWTGKILSASRSDLAELLVRQEVGRPGAYLLIGDDPAAVGGQRCYVGEADAIGSRLREHAGLRGKDFWSRAVLIISKDDNLTKAHGRYLESRLIALAKQAGRSQVENGTAPDPPPLPEADVSDMEYFVAQLHIVLPVLGVNLFRGRAARPADLMSDAVEKATSPVFRLNVARAGFSASAQEIDGEFTVLAGSTVSAAVRTSGKYAASTAAAYAAYEALHQKLRDDGSIDTSTSPARLTRDVVFSSPSTAGAIVTGRSCNGRKAWTDETGMTYGSWESRGVVDDAREAPISDH